MNLSSIAAIVCRCCTLQLKIVLSHDRNLTESHMFSRPQARIGEGETLSEEKGYGGELSCSVTKSVPSLSMLILCANLGAQGTRLSTSSGSTLNPRTSKATGRRA